MKELSTKFSILAVEVGSTASDQMLLRSLYFKDIRNRETQITESYKATFDWLLDPNSRTEFVEWLASKNGTYWISGKAGSGKSTLMKHLTAHSRTMEILKLWAGSQKLVTASFYFWNAGTVLQKSQEGLFRSLLYEILRQCPNLIRNVCAAKAVAFRPFENEVEPWTLQDLRQALGQLKEGPYMQARFCFFIDGLDEYDGHADHLIDVLENFQAVPDIKLCVSSRPWNEFVDAFGRDPDFQLSLEDLTREDIRIYVRETLEDNPRFSALAQRDQRTQELVQEIVDKARGVFLWVVLVVRSLLNGLRNADRISDLQKRLRDFPETLETYFSHIHFSIEEIYREQTAEAFTFAVVAAEPLSLITYSFLDEESLGAMATGKVTQLTSEEIAVRQDDMRRRLNGRCKGLLEVVSDGKAFGHSYPNSIFKPKVDFLHRTAYDFLDTKDMRKMISDNLKPDFVPARLLCEAFLAQLHAIDNLQHQGVVQELLEDLTLYARALQVDLGISSIAILDEANAIVANRAFSFASVEKDELGFLEFLTRREMHSYVAEVLNRRSELACQDNSRLLRSAFEPEDTKYFTATYDLAMIELLLAHGAHPNDAWGDFMQAIHRKNTYADDETLLRIVGLMLKHGADPQQRVIIGETTLEPRKESGRAADLYKKAPKVQSQYAPAVDVLVGRFGEERARAVYRQARAVKKPLFSRILPWRLA